MIDEIQEMLDELERAKIDLDRVITSLNSYEIGKKPQLEDEGKESEETVGKPVTIIDNPQQEDFVKYLSFFASRFDDSDLILKTKDKDAIEKTFKKIEINFGIYKGKNLQEILQEDQAYLVWLLLKAGIEVPNPEKLIAELNKEVMET
ncbi:MAG: exodeoxyribonuclease X C-terminal domain-containing protein [Candidatus Hodarchaeales archaeon]